MGKETKSIPAHCSGRLLLEGRVLALRSLQKTYDHIDSFDSPARDLVIQPIACTGGAMIAIRPWPGTLSLYTLERICLE
ncbi:MAG: hypothetical protein J2P49_04295 [Methylocapsa sp.]|nr:hypothetical protein [Methylocapsa sp.]